MYIYKCMHVTRPHSYSESHLHGEEEDAEEGTQTSQEVELVHLPEPSRRPEIDEADHGRDDDRGQYEVGRVVEQRHEEQHGDEHGGRHHDVRHGRLRPGVVVHRRPRERSCNTHTERESFQDPAAKKDG